MYFSKKIDNRTALNYFISFIENSESEIERINSIKFIRDIDIKTRQFFELLENLLTSDENYEIRGLAGQIITLRYFEKAKRLINWAFDNITSVTCLTYLIEGLSKAQDEDAQKRKFGTPYKTYNLVVSLKELPKFRYKYVYQLSINNLKEFILSRKRRLSQFQIEQLKNWLTKLRLINPRKKSPFFFI